MTVAAAQRIMDMAMDLPDEAEGPVINFMVRFKKPETSESKEFAEYEALMDQAQAWAAEAGLTPDDIAESIRAVRQRHRA